MEGITMIHISKIDGQEYDIAVNICPEDRKSYDITTIFKFMTPEEEVIANNKAISNNEEYSPVKLIGWYFGEYEFDMVEYYIKEYLKTC